jgi:hypothetical protein
VDGKILSLNVLENIWVMEGGIVLTLSVWLNEVFSGKEKEEHSILLLMGKIT